MRGGDTTYTRTDLMDKRNQIVRHSKELSEDIQRQIDNLLAQSGEIDEFIAVELLYQLGRALLQTDDVVYERTKDAVNRRVQVVKEQSAYAFAFQAVNKYWQDAQAKQIDEPTIAPKRLLEDYFTPALEEAKRQLTYYEKNSSYRDVFKDRLRALIEDAQKWRDSLNSAEKSLTSGALIEDYVTNLDYIRTAPPGLMIQIYDMFGTVTGSEPKDKAYATYSERALDLARKKLITYMDGGEGRLGIRKLLELGEPRAAQKIYEEYEEKFGKLEREYVKDIARLSERQDLYRCKADIDAAMRQFDAVETEAQKIAELADKADSRDVLIGLWNQHQSNIKNYPLAEHSSVAVRDTRDLLRRRILMYLYAAADQIDVAVNAADLIQGRKLISDNRTLLELPILKGEEIITRINNYGEEMNDIEEELNTLYTTLDDLSRRATTDTAGNLGNELAKLREKHKKLVDKVPLFGTVSNQILSRDNDKADVQRLVGYLHGDYSDMNILQTQADYAKQKAGENPAYVAIAGELAAYIEFLKARDLPLTQRIDKLNNLVTSGRISDAVVREKLEVALSDATSQQRRTQTNINILREAKEAMNKGDYTLAWEKLDTMRAFNTKEEKSEWGFLLVESVRKQPLDVRFDVNLLKRLGEFHKTLNEGELPARYQTLYDVQMVRSSTNTDDIKKGYKDLIFRLSGHDAQVVIALQGEVDKEDFVNKSTLSLSRRPDVGTEEFTNWLYGLTDSSQQGIGLAEQSKSIPKVAIEYYLTSIRLDLLFIQYSNIQGSKQPIVARVQTSATAAKNILKANEPIEKALSYFERNLVEVGLVIADIERAITEMPNKLTDNETDIKRFKDNFDKLNGVFGQGARARDVLQEFATQYDAHVERLYSDLRNKSASLDGVDRYKPSAFLTYVKMLILKPNDSSDMRQFIATEDIKKRMETQLDDYYKRFMTDGSVIPVEMVKELDVQIGNMQKLIIIAETLPNLSDLADNMRDIKPQIESLRVAIDQFDKRTDTFTIRLNKYPLTYATWSTYETTIIQDFESYMTDVMAYFQGLKRGTLMMSKAHPYVVFVSGEVDKALTMLDTITENLKAILDFGSQQKFANALQVVAHFGSLGEVFDAFKEKAIYAERIPTKFVTSTRDASATADLAWELPSLNGYQKLVSWLRAGDSTIQVIQNWRDGHKDIKATLDSLNAKLAEAEVLHKKADFTNSMNILNGLKDNSSDNIIQQYRQIPYQSDTPSVDNYDFAKALTLCTYRDGKQKIEEAQQEYQQLIEMKTRIEALIMKYGAEKSVYDEASDKAWALIQEMKQRRNRNKENDANSHIATMVRIAPNAMAVKRYNQELSQLK